MAVRQQCRLGDQALQRARCFGEAQHRIADQVGGGLVARDQQQGAEAQQLGDTQLLAVDLGREQQADQILARPAPALLDHAQEVLRHLPVGAAVAGLRRRPGGCRRRWRRTIA